MAKNKSNPEKGLRTVSIDFAGKTRTIKFTHSIVGDFEADANAILRSTRVIEQGAMIFADGIMERWIGNAKILSCALSYGLKHEEIIENIDAAIDSFIENGGTMQDLIRAVITAYRYATNPSSVASLMRSWQISDDRQKFLTDAENQAMDSMEKAIADAKAKEKENMTPGSQSTDSLSSN